jgi:hypothetical protein
MRFNIVSLGMVASMLMASSFVYALENGVTDPVKNVAEDSKIKNALEGEKLDKPLSNLGLGNSKPLSDLTDTLGNVLDGNGVKGVTDRVRSSDTTDAVKDLAGSTKDGLGKRTYLLRRKLFGEMQRRAEPSTDAPADIGTANSAKTDATGKDTTDVIHELYENELNENELDENELDENELDENELDENELDENDLGDEGEGALKNDASAKTGLRRRENEIDEKENERDEKDDEKDEEEGSNKGKKGKSAKRSTVDAEVRDSRLHRRQTGTGTDEEEEDEEEPEEDENEDDEPGDATPLRRRR